jgi:hypothetical protein
LLGLSLTAFFSTQPRPKADICFRVRYPVGYDNCAMSLIVLGALFTLAVLVMALSGFQIAQRTLMFMAALLAGVLLAVWFFLRPT